MLSESKSTDLLKDYYHDWVIVYKEGAIRDVTLSKYHMCEKWLENLAPDLRLCDVTRKAYQNIINEYAKEHERQTVMDFHHQLKGAILDAVDEGLIPHDPTRKVIIKGKTPVDKKQKYLNQFQLQTLLQSLKLEETINWDWFILLVAKTGMRFSEALAITPKDFDFAHQTVSINKTWNYKDGGGFAATKNRSSVRKIQIDWQLVMQFATLVKGLRHTHASILLFAGVSIASVARRLGHASMTTTQKTYLHIIQELENQDIDLVMRSLSNLT